MWRTMCDSDQIGALVDCAVVTTYADLITTPAQLADVKTRHPNSVVAFIDRGLGDPLGVATIGDVEPGALTPAQMAGKIRQWQAADRRYCTAYSDQNDLPAVVQACDGLRYWHWIAGPGQLAVPGHPGAIVQCLFAPPKGPHIDLSVIKDDTWHPEAISVTWAWPLAGQLADVATRVHDALTLVQAHLG